MGGIEAGRHTLQVMERKYACGFLCIARPPARTHARTHTQSCRILMQSTYVSPHQIHHRASPASICVRMVMLRACAHISAAARRAPALPLALPHARAPHLHLRLFLGNRQPARRVQRRRRRFTAFRWKIGEGGRCLGIGRAPSTRYTRPGRRVGELGGWGRARRGGGGYVEVGGGRNGDD